MQHSGQVNSVKFSTISSFFASAGSDQYIKIWDSDNWSLLFNIFDDKGIPKSILFIDDFNFIIWGGSDKMIKVWNYVDSKYIN